MPVKLSSRVSKKFILRLISLGVLINGLLIVLDALISHITIGRRVLITHDFRVTVPVVIGMTLVYLGTLLHRRKHAAWILTLIVYSVSLGVNLALVATPLMEGNEFSVNSFFSKLFLPLIVLGGLAHYHEEFKVKSDIRSFMVVRQPS